MPFNYSYAISNDCLIIRSRYKDKPHAYRYPIGSGDKCAAFKELLAYCKENGEPFRLYSLTSDMLDSLKCHCCKIEAAPLRDYFDYVYNVEDLINLTGKKYHAKRNHLNNFLQNNYEYQRITSADADEVMACYDKWLFERENEDNYFLQLERESISHLLANIDKLELTAAMLRVNSNICAFTIGEELNPETVVVHIEKADTSVKGAYPAINNLFLKNEWSTYKYVNREDDSGIEGLRKAKLSYYPAFFIEKFEVTNCGSD